MEKQLTHLSSNLQLEGATAGAPHPLLSLWEAATGHPEGSLETLQRLSPPGPVKTPEGPPVTLGVFPELCAEAHNPAVCSSVPSGGRPAPVPKSVPVHHLPRRGLGNSTLNTHTQSQTQSHADKCVGFPWQWPVRWPLKATRLVLSL